MSAMTTFAPSWRSASTRPSPMPLAPPVTTATLPLKSCTDVSPRLRRISHEFGPYRRSENARNRGRRGVSDRRGSHRRQRIGLAMHGAAGIATRGLTARLPVYLAGPDVFLRESAEVGRAKQAICARHGLDGRYPGDGPDVSGLPLGEQARALFESCVEMMDACVAGLVNLTPFRGPSADVGTAFEMGYLFGRGCHGLRVHVRGRRLHDPRRRRRDPRRVVRSRRQPDAGRSDDAARARSSCVRPSRGRGRSPPSPRSSSAVQIAALELASDPTA